MSAVASQDLLLEIVRRLQAVFSPVTIYLFGSQAYGLPHPGSDIDLLVIVQDDERTAYERDAAAYRALLGIEFPVDVQVYTHAEFSARCQLPVSFERTVLEKGKPIYVA
jgi:predicted nucleotidyltransferase